MQYRGHARDLELGIRKEAVYELTLKKNNIYLYSPTSALLWSSHSYFLDHASCVYMLIFNNVLGAVDFASRNRCCFQGLKYFFRSLCGGPGTFKSVEWYGNRTRISLVWLTDRAVNFVLSFHAVSVRLVFFASLNKTLSVTLLSLGSEKM